VLFAIDLDWLLLKAELFNKDYLKEKQGDMFKKIQKLNSPRELKTLYPVDVKSKKFFDESIKKILSGTDRRLLAIVGPCSLDGEEGIYAYLEKLADLRRRVEEKILLVPRLYTAKPRSRDGFKGLLHSPDIADCAAEGTLSGKFLNDDFCKGLALCRKILTTAVNQFGFGCADELLYPWTYKYFGDAVSYYAIGARSSQNQEHRFMASAIDSAVGIKNPLSGNLSALADSVSVAKKPNRFVSDGYEAESYGNPYAHGILRGYADSEGRQVGNLSKAGEYLDACGALGFVNAPVVIDVSHGNSGKDYLKQVDGIKHVACEISNAMRGEGCKTAGAIRGIMLESYLFDGRGDGYNFGRSVTDGCLGYEKTERALLELCEKI